jgi:hypothetical protein
MITHKTHSIPSIMCRSALVALGCSFIFAFVQAPATKAADAVTLRPLADEAPSLPLTAKFEKVADSESGPYVLNLENTSKDTIKVSAKILSSVTFHAESKSKNLPERAIEPGQVWAIPGLATADRVTISAKGYAPLELTVP